MEPKGLALYYKSSNSPKPQLYFSFSQRITIQDSLVLVSLNGALETDEGHAYDLNLDYRLYTYNDKVDIGAWEVTFALFRRDNLIWETECQLPERCGTFGLCEDSQCVACPSSKGLLGWSKSCVPEKLTSCDAKSFHYYKVEGKCTSDCKCLGYFFKQDTSRCWIAYDLKTLTKVANSTYVRYIKAPNH
ncbi:epidermis-specific secreted glycoprotein EP1-like [Pyrus ussuriensis x Pyrus communis]|uniref:Epidermis-specific secreted glycoprotein EP1-like n=1 Tax=Pyrus ussuriensis x Pyrus communis TaxID=2448454 RepID=A0A5N5FW17_9ROSA|nr:epidermis-specific secreted glycoprotein EP1-like [Pyrus ussuriensis x Pyrus communis]